MLRNFKKFEVGHYYVYTGNKTEGNWNLSGAMDFAIKHEILQCSNNFKYNYAFADFKGYERVDDDNGWDWSNGFDNWVEVESPDAVFEEGDSILEYKRQHESWHILALGKSQLTDDKKRNGYENYSYSYYILKRKTKESEEEEILNCPFCSRSTHSTRKEFLIDYINRGKRIYKCCHCNSCFSFDSTEKNIYLLPNGQKVFEALRSKFSLGIQTDKDNPFKKYIRKKKYLTFSKKKKHTK